MFSSHLPKKNNLPPEYLFVGTGLLLVVALLVGIAVVASGQVRKAELRASLLASQRSAMLSCLETLGGSALNKCLLEARAMQDVPGGSRPSTTLADNSSTYSRSPAVQLAPNPGFISASFSTQR